jgi:hypothetical protein
MLALEKIWCVEHLEFWVIVAQPACEYKELRLKHREKSNVLRRAFISYGAEQVGQLTCERRVEMSQKKKKNAKTPVTIFKLKPKQQYPKAGNSVNHKKTSPKNENQR